jgi:hypothetical protein
MFIEGDGHKALIKTVSYSTVQSLQVMFNGMHNYRILLEMHKVFFCLPVIWKMTAASAFHTSECFCIKHSAYNPANVHSTPIFTSQNLVCKTFSALQYCCLEC